MRFRNDDSGVSEVIGFVLSFALSAVFLMMALTSFYTAKNNTEAVVSAVELRAIADQVASAVIEAGLVGQEFEHATYNRSVSIPHDLNGVPYYVVATRGTIYANATGEQFAASASTLKLDAVTGFIVTGRVDSSQQRVIVTYSLQNSGSTKSIHIHGE